MADVRLIDANALKSLLIEVLERIKESPKMTRDEMHIISGCHMLCEMIDNAPAIDAVPVLHGRWVLVSKGNFSPGGLEIEEKCSECGRYVYRYEDQPQDNYCPNCGAKMDGGAE